MTEGVSGSVEAEVRGDGDRIERTQLRAVLRQRVNAGRIGRLRGPWRRAGGMAEGGGECPCNRRRARWPQLPRVGHSIAPAWLS